MPPVIPSVLIVLPDHLTATALAEALRVHGDVVVVADAWDALEEALDAHPPDAVVVDVVVGGVPVLNHLHQLVAAYAPTHFVVCTLHPDGVVVQRALLAGAAAVVGHDVSSAALGDALAALCRDGRWPDGLGQAAVSHSARRAPLEPLSARLRQVNELLWQGCTHQQIAAKLGVGVKAVEAHVAAIRQAYAVARGVPGPWEAPGRRGRRRDE